MSDITVTPTPVLSAASVEELREKLMSIRRDAISVVRLAECLLDLPPEQSAIRTRAERRAEYGEHGQ